MRSSANKWSFLLLVVALTAWIGWLRWPSLGAIWNLDEGIHATIARTILDGGVMYRDAIDQRTPLSYYLVAALASVTGPNNLWALHLALVGMISATATALFLLARRWHGTAAGIWAAAVFAALSSSLFYPGDAYALNTEWFLIFFASWSAWWFWGHWHEARFWPLFGTGAGYAAAFLCKQPGLLDFGAPLALVIYLLALGNLRPAQAARILAALAAGFVTVTAAALAYFWWRGALADFYFYAWTYNLVYYGAEISTGDRLHSAAALAGLLRAEYPAVLLAVLAAIIGGLHRVAQRRADAVKTDAQPPAFFLLVWLALSVAGAASSGRVYGHYYIQALPALSLAAAWILSMLTKRAQARGRPVLRFVCVGAALVVAWGLLIGPVRGRSRPAFGPDASTTAAEFIKARSAPGDRVFVWGYHPDFYLYADRQPASRFIYCSFLTGLVPWTNTAPDRDTRYAIVPGAMETLLSELDTARPAFLVDTSLAPYRSFTKYPLEKFPRLAAFVATNYLEVDPEKFRPHGFRVLMLKDSARRTPFVLAGEPKGARPDAPNLGGPAVVEPVAVEYTLVGSDAAGRLQRLELLVDGTSAAGLSFLPAAALSARVTVDFARLGTGSHQFRARATSANGETQTGPALTVNCTSETLPQDRLAEFALPVSGAGSPPVRLRAPYGAAASDEAGVRVFFAHAPSAIRYELPAAAVRVRGRFGFRPGAYAPENAGRTDGSDFLIVLINPAGQRTELFRRELRPVGQPADRSEQAFEVSLPTAARGSKIEFVITNGPAGNAASDWTYWADLQLKTSR